MSGVFLVVQETKRKPHESVLRPTKGGYPHITLVYSGKVLTPSELSVIGKNALDYWLTDSGGLPTLQLTAEQAHINTFTEKRGSVERERHDVLLRLTLKDSAFVGRLRSEYVPKKDFTFHYPHVTHSVHYEKGAAEDALAALKDAFPIEVHVVGYTID